MNKAALLDEIMRLPVEERLQLGEELWESLLKIVHGCQRRNSWRKPAVALRITAAILRQQFQRRGFWRDFSRVSDEQNDYHSGRG